jgi:dihydropyrimidinase
VKYDLVLQSDSIVTPKAVRSGWIAISGELIKRIGYSAQIPEAYRTIKAPDKIIIPGVIDAHVHCRTGYSPAADTIHDASVAAVFGGVTSMFLHIGPSKGTRPIPGTVYRAVDTRGVNGKEYFNRIINEGETTSLIDFGIHCMVPPDEAFFSQIPELANLGISSFKMMLGYHPARGWTVDDYMLMKVLELISSSNGIAMFHCENGNAIGFLEERLMASGMYDAAHFLASRPSLLEGETLHRVSILCQLASCPMYVVHLSSAEGLTALREGRSRGCKIAAETCPQYLILSDADTLLQGVRCKMAPPLRTRDDNSSLWEALGDGTLDIVASDHAPWNLETQKLSASDFGSAPFGAPGVETLLTTLYSEGVKSGRISLPRMVEVLCANPARYLSLYPTKGAITEGSHADLVILDPNCRWRLDESALHSKAGYSAYHGRWFDGKVITTIVRGKVLVEDDKLVGQSANGRFLKRFTGPSK